MEENLQQGDILAHVEADTVDTSRNTLKKILIKTQQRRHRNRKIGLKYIQICNDPKKEKLLLLT